ncbi:site-specific integrase [bacterium]|nr:site-specific integrase [bacterium]
MDIDLHPNRESGELKKQLAEELLLKVHLKLLEGWDDSEADNESDAPLLEKLFTFQVSTTFTTGYRKAVEKTKVQFEHCLREQGLSKLMVSELKTRHCQNYLNQFLHQPSTYNHERKHLSAILTSIMGPMGMSCPVKLAKKLKEKPSLHKPIDNIPAVLSDIQAFHENLHLCCLLTYACLLRPHREIRELRWSDFSSDLGQISLPATRNKSGRNRIVPVPAYVQQLLTPREPQCNIFSGNAEPYNEDYFKCLWSRYKRSSQHISAEQTLYSFRHTGAIEIFKRTGSLQILQQAMGHASLAVTLGYLRNLDVPQLTIDMMPNLGVS